MVKKIDSKEKINKTISEEDLSNYLGVKKYNFGEIENENKIGVATGLAWTEVGGEILKIETVNMPGKGKMQITGKLGEVMQESVKAAKSYVRSKSLEFGILPSIFEKKEVREEVSKRNGARLGRITFYTATAVILFLYSQIDYSKTVLDKKGQINMRDWSNEEKIEYFNKYNYLMNLVINTTC